jgi:hypothetical protein
MTKQEVVPSWPELSEHKDQIRNLESLFTEMLSRVSALESQVTQMASQVPFLGEAGYSTSIRCAATEDRLSQLELDVAKALHRDGGPPNAALRGGARRTVVALTQDPEGCGSDAESSDHGEDAHKKRRSKKRAVKNNGKPSKGRNTPFRSGARVTKHPEDEDPSLRGLWRLSHPDRITRPSSRIEPIA